MKKIFFIASLCLSGVLSAADAPTLFFQTARQGTITQLSKNHYTLSFKNTPEYTDYFISSKSKTGVITTHDFLLMWKNPVIKKKFIANPPHASLVLVNEKGKQQNFNALVLNPGFLEGKLSYQITVIDKKVINPGKLKEIGLVFNDITEIPEGM